MRFVTTAIAVIATHGSSTGRSSGQKRLPSGVYGYGSDVTSGKNGASATWMLSQPCSSAVRATSRNSLGSTMKMWNPNRKDVGASGARGAGVSAKPPAPRK